MGAHSTILTGARSKPNWFKGENLRSDEVFNGIFTALQFREGFGIHTLNAWSLRHFRTTSERKPGVVLHCFLEGHADAELAGEPMNLGRPDGHPVRMVLTSVDEAQEFSRRCDPGEYVRKVNIMLSDDWLENNGLALPSEVAMQANGGLRVEWLADAHEIRVMEELASKSGFDSPVERLQAEAMALGLVADCFAKFAGTDAEKSLSNREHAQLRRIEQMAHAPGKLPTLAELAKSGGVSQSKMRRLFQMAHGCSVLSYVRKVRLEQARAGLENNLMTVAEAAYLAGYGSPENFSTAFRRQHGISPSEAIRRR